jgi:3-methyladenine DNA glycosylase/8-oxoguanine DNA glycosylase
VNNSLNSLINEIVNKIKEYFWLDDAINKAETEEERNRLEEEQRRVLQEIVNKIKEYFSIEDTLDSILSQLNELKDKLF